MLRSFQCNHYSETKHTIPDCQKGKTLKNKCRHGIPSHMRGEVRKEINGIKKIKYYFGCLSAV